VGLAEKEFKVITAMISPLNHMPTSFGEKRPHFHATPKFGNERFDSLRSTEPELTQSNWFRRSQYYDNRGASTKFKDVATVLAKVIKTTTPAKMLVVGVADGQEPMSILATVSHLTVQKPLEDVIDLHCVDIRSRLSDEFVETQASFKCHDWDTIPKIIEKFAKSSFETTQIPFQISYKLKKPIRDYMQKVFANCDPSSPEAATHWDTAIEDFAQAAPCETYDAISYNNIVNYIDSESVRREILSNLCRMLKPGGFLITDPHLDNHNQDCFNNFTKFKDGIWCKNQSQAASQKTWWGWLLKP
jgi:chemotaxis methyl-accepting protein methylase